jgi:hypothetical protein
MKEQAIKEREKKIRPKREAAWSSINQVIAWNRSINFKGGIIMEEERNMDQINNKILEVWKEK